MGLWAVSFFFLYAYNITRLVQMKILWLLLLLFSILPPCWLFFSRFFFVCWFSPSLHHSFPHFFIHMIPYGRYTKENPFLNSILLFFSSLLSTPFVHKKTLWMELLFFVFYHFFFPSFLTLYKVETLLLQQKKNTLFSTIRVLSSWPHPLHLCHFSLFLKQKM